MKLTPIQSNFSAGELSPRFLSQYNTEGYAAGLAKCENYIATKHGPLIRRKGFQHVFEIPGTFARVFGFQLDPGDTPGEAFPVVVSNSGKLRVLIPGASAEIGRDIISNGDFDRGLYPWTVVNSTALAGTAHWADGNVDLTAPSSSSDYIAVNESLVIDATTAPKYRILVDLEDPVLGVDMTQYGRAVYPAVRVRVGTTAGGGEIYSGPWEQQRNSVSAYVSVPTGAASFTIHVSVQVMGGSYPQIELVPNPDPTKPPTKGQYGTNVRTVKRIRMGETTGPQILSPTYVELSHTWTTDQIRDMYVAMHPNSRIMYMLCPTLRPRQLRWSSPNWILEDVTFTGMPTDWTGTDWPSCITFANGRSWWSGVRSKPNTIYGSKSGSANYTNMTTGANADDGVKFEMTRRGLIRWLNGDKNLLVGAASTEYIITSDGGVITSSDFQIDPQSSNGSNDVQPVSMGNSVLYVSADGRKVFSADYKWTEQSWVSRDITFSSEHMTENDKIIEMARCRNPEDLLWAVTGNGNLICGTVDPYTGRTGWHRHPTDGAVFGAASVDISGRSVLYIVTYRLKESGGDKVQSIRLEKYSPDTDMDASSVYLSDTDISSVTGATYLAGRTVQVKVDDARHPDVHVDSSGLVVLQSSGKRVEIGLPYLARAVTLPADYGSQTGSAASMQKKWIKAAVRVVSSVMPTINGYRPPERSPSTRMGFREPNATTDVEVSLDSKFDRLAQLTIEQNLPFDCMIVGIFGELEQNTR